MNILYYDKNGSLEKCPIIYKKRGENLDTLNKILFLIEERGLKQQFVLKEFGYDKSFFSDWKAGKIKHLSGDKIIKFAEYFDVSTDYLLGWTQKRTSYRAENVNNSAVAQGHNSTAKHRNVAELSKDEK